VTGRDVEEKTLALTKQGVQWVMEGDAEEWRMSQTRATTIKALENAGEDGSHFRDLAEEVGLKAGTMKVTLSRMVTAGQAKRLGNGLYSSVTCNHCNPVTVNGGRDSYTVTPVTPVTELQQLHTLTTLSADLVHWPADPRYRVADLERQGMKRIAAMERVRREYEAQS
jgi:hypothetical protein